MPSSSPVHKAVARIKAVVAYAKIVRDPNQLGEVFELADSLSDEATMSRIARGIRRHPSGDAALAARKRVDADLASLEQLPPGTLGFAYAKFMRDNNLVKESIPSLAVVNEGDFIRAHLYETHDMWHAMTGFGPDVAGELGLQAFYAAQIDGPLPAAILAAGLLNTALFSLDDTSPRMEAIVRGWEGGRRAQLLFGYDWSTSFDKPIGVARAEIGLPAEGIGKAAPAITTSTPSAARIESASVAPS